MRKKHEVNGIPIRGEILACYEKVLADERYYDWIILHCAGMETGSHQTSIAIACRMKQTELDFIVADFPRNSLFKWDGSIIYEEGDATHFGKTYRFDKRAVE